MINCNTIEQYINLYFDEGNRFSVKNLSLMDIKENGKLMEYCKENSSKDPRLNSVLAGIYEKAKENFLFAGMFKLRPKQEEIYSLYLKAAEANYPRAMARVGYYLEKDNKLDDAVSWYLKAIDLGYEEAKLYLAKAYIKLNKKEESFKIIDEIKYKYDEALALYARALANGIGCEANISEAIKYYYLAYENGNKLILKSFLGCLIDIKRNGIPAHRVFKYLDSSDEKIFRHYKALLLLSSDNPNQDAEAAIEILEKLKDSFHPAYEVLGFLYDEGEFVVRNYKKAFDCFLKAAHYNSPASLFMLGSYYYDGKAVEQDLYKCREYYEKAAKYGDKDAMFNLALMYDDGDGVDKDYEKAAQYYQMAIAHGDTGSYCNLGLMYEEGRGVDQDYKKAIELYKLGFEAGDYTAAYNLGLAYKEGEMIEQNYELALNYFVFASKGDPGAICEIGVAYYYGNHVTQNYDRAISYFRQALGKKCDDALLYMGICYLNGHGVEQDYNEAYRYFYESYQKHEDEAAYYLGHMHENGYGCLKSMAKAIRYYEITTDKKGKKRLAEIYYSMDEYRDLSLAYEYACDTPGAEEIASNIAGNIKNIIDIELFNDYGGNTLRYLNNLNIVVKLTKVNSKNIEEIIIDEGVTKIYPKAFSDFTNLKKITIPSTVEIIKPETFSNLANLEIVNISEGLKRIEAYAFENCNKIKNIVIPHSIDFVSLHAFEGHNLDTLTIPSWFISFVERIFGKYTESISLDDRTMLIKFK